MSTPLAVKVPLVNPNEVEATLAALHVQPGQPVEAGQLLATLETTKAASDVHAEVAGYVLGLQARQGQVLRAGEVLCYLAETPDAPIPQPVVPDDQAQAQRELPEGVRITAPALELARSRGLALEQLPRGVWITEERVRELLAAGTPGAIAELDPGAIVIYGGGGHGKSLIELVQAMGGYRLAGVIDDAVPAGGEVLGLPVLGGAAALSGLYAQGVRQAVNAVGGIGNIASRVQVFERLTAAGFSCPKVIHPTAFVEASAEIADGAQIFPHAYVGSSAKIGFGAIVNTGAIVSHDVELGDYSNVSPGAMLAGAVRIGERCLIGMGVTVNLEVHIGDGARVGNGATVKADVPAGGVVHAGAVWPA